MLLRVLARETKRGSHWPYEFEIPKVASVSVELSASY